MIKKSSSSWIVVRKSGRLRKTGKGLTTPESEFRGGLRGWQTTVVVVVVFLGVRRRASGHPLWREGRREEGEAVWHSPRGKYRSANWNSVQQPSLIYVWNRSLRTLSGPTPSSRCIPASSLRAFRVHERICALFIRRDCEWWATSIPLPPHPRISWKFRREVGKSRTRLPS